MKLEKIFTKKVWADEIFYAFEAIDGVTFDAPEGVTFTADSHITGTSTVAVKDVVLSELAGVVTATVNYLVQEELTVVINAEPGPGDFDLEYQFEYAKAYEYQKFTLPEDLEITDLEGQVFRFEGTVTIANVDLPVDGSTGTFDNEVSTMTKLKVTQDIQPIVCLGTAPYVVTAPITTTIAP
ncbi:hypothetical protein EOM82_05420 [bacterium]|nr:hypothetical protein [bacterium]